MKQSTELKVTVCRRCGGYMQICADRFLPWDEKRAINRKAGNWFVAGHGWCCEKCKEEYLRVNENQQA